MYITKVMEYVTTTAAINTTATTFATHFLSFLFFFITNPPSNGYITINGLRSTLDSTTVTPDRIFSLSLAAIFSVKRYSVPKWPKSSRFIPVSLAN